MANQQTFEGRVVRLNTKTGTNSRGNWVLYSLKLAEENGDELPWASVGFKHPNVNEGDSVSFTAEEKDGRYSIVQGTTVKKIAAEKPATPVKATATAAAAAKPAKAVAAAPNYRGTHPEDAKRMTYAAARSAAIQVVGLLLMNKGLPISQAATKAADAKRFDEVTAAIDKLTVQFHHDGMSLRKLETVADTVTDTASDGPIPGDEPGGGDAQGGNGDE